MTLDKPALLEGLKTFLRIPSISALSEHKPDIRRAAGFVRSELAAAGLQSRLIESPSDPNANPLVYAEWLNAPGKPTILFYGHYDVQPPDPLDEWLSPPFEPEVRNDDLFARGAADDKGQVYLQIKAVDALLKRDGRLPVNVKFLIEGEEETGGEHIETYVKSKPPLLAADAVVVCDTEMFAPGLPTICIGLRGMVYTELFVEGANHDLHSGVYGGAAPNPIMAIAEILCALKDRDGHVLIPGFYDKVQPPSPKEREAWARLPFDEKDYVEKEMGARELTGEPGVPALRAPGRAPRSKSTASAAASWGKAPRPSSPPAPPRSSACASSPIRRPPKQPGNSAPRSPPPVRAASPPRSRFSTRATHRLPTPTTATSPRQPGR